MNQIKSTNCSILKQSAIVTCQVLFVLLLFLLLTDVAKSAVISSVSGTVTDRQPVTITGSSFGSGPKVIVFDDFESGTVGANIKTGAGSAKYGRWTARYGSSYYGATSAVSGRVNFSSNFAGGYANQIQANLPNDRNVFVSYWVYVPAGMNYPGEGTKDGDNWKIVWVQGTSTTDDDFVIPLRMATSTAISRNEQNPKYMKYFGMNMSKGNWTRIWVWIKGSTSSSSQDGEVKLFELTNSGVVRRVNNTGVNTLKATGAFERIRINGYGRRTPNCITSFDDVYVASGPNAQARIEIGNASTYNASTKLTILTPTSWSNSKVIATVNVGSFSAGDPAYLFVVNANGQASAGFPIEIGGYSGALASQSLGALNPPQDPRVEN